MIKTYYVYWPFLYLQPIKCGYCGWLINGLLHVGIIEHSCLKHYNEEKHLLHIDENNVASISKYFKTNNYL